MRKVRKVQKRGVKNVNTVAGEGKYMKHDKSKQTNSETLDMKVI